MNELMTTDKAIEHANALKVITPYGLDLPSEITRLDYQCLGILVMTTDDTVGWWRGDLALRLREEYPNDYLQAWTELIPKYDRYTLDNDARTASRYTTEDRREWIDAGLSYSHCRIVSHLPDEIRHSLLTDCVLKKWKVWQLEEHLYGKGKRNRSSRDAPPLRERFNDFLATVDEAHHEYYTNAICDFLDYLEGQR